MNTRRISGSNYVTKVKHILRRLENQSITTTERVRLIHQLDNLKRWAYEVKKDIAQGDDSLPRRNAVEILKKITNASLLYYYTKISSDIIYATTLLELVENCDISLENHVNVYGSSEKPWNTVFGTLPPPSTIVRIFHDISLKTLLP